jgi:hypothetical protein
MLQFTMGCPQTFDLRRQELAEINKDASLDTSLPDDEAVVNSFAGILCRLLSEFNINQ